jgi:hypothetical protein
MVCSQALHGSEVKESTKSACGFGVPAGGTSTRRQGAPGVGTKPYVTGPVGTGAVGGVYLGMFWWALAHA